jgi:hypothetical protein
VGGLVNQLHQNQRILEKSHNNTDDQFAVLTRLFISRFNDLAEKVSVLGAVATGEAIPDGFNFKVEPITYEGVNKLFSEYDGFKSRSDFRDHFRTWYMGEDLSKLPPPPPSPAPEPPKQEAKEEKVEQAPSTPEEPAEAADFPEGAQVFGGDYAERQSRNEDPNQGDAPQQVDSQTNQVPAV